MLRLTLAVLHLFALSMGVSGVWTRGRSLAARPLELRDVRRAFVADNWWGIAAVLWISTGLWRLLAGTEKPTSYYLNDSAFAAKMGIFLVIGLLEIWPMITLIRWRRGSRRDAASWQPNPVTATWIRRISYTETLLLLAMVVAAVLMARGYGYHAPSLPR